MNGIRPAAPVALLTLALIAFAMPSAAQIPEKFTNLKILNEGVSRGELVGMMRQFAGALDVRCNYCHVGNADGSLEGMDFASDDKTAKRSARVMMRMTKAINADYVSQVEQEVVGDERVKVKCMTCHRGQEEPIMLEDVLAEAKVDGGMDALTAKYDELREKYYGRATYDFGANVLNGMAESTARAGDVEGAKALLELNLTHNPESAFSYLMMGQIEMQSGNKIAAISAVKKAIELEPDNDWARQMLARMEGEE
jgi:tetratricopeptide (TPR) repeat protein